MIGSDPAMRTLVAEAGIRIQLGRLVYDARTEAGLTQTQLAKRVGTTQSVIARLEDADYKGHSLSMLNRVARALNRRLELRFLPGTSRNAPAA